MRLGYFPEATVRPVRDPVAMTMYLPNRDVRPTGYEAGEFIDSPPEPSVPESPLAASEADNDEADDSARGRV